MFYAPFWIMMGIFAAIAGTAIFFQGFRFIDFQLLVGMIAVALIYDMIFCKWLHYYSYVVTGNLKAFYSLIFCIIGYPSIGLTYIKFIPSSWGRLALYTAIWIVALTLTEIAMKPLNIVVYNKWRIIPYSPIIYAVSFVLEFGYFKLLEKRIGKIT